MSIKGQGQTLLIGKQRVTLKEQFEKDVLFEYSNLRVIEYQFADNSRLGFMRFKLTDGNQHIFVFKPMSNEPISRAISFIREYAPEVIQSEANEKFGISEQFSSFSLKKKLFPLVIPIIIVFISLMSFFDLLDAGTDSDNFITLEEYNKCETGMTYEECVKIIGSSGEPMAESDIGDINATAYIWYGDAFSGANVELYFIDGKLHSKAQFGL